MKNNSVTQNNESADQEIDLNQVIKQYGYYWKWFIISVIAVLSIAAGYLYYATPMYKVEAKILFESEGKASGEMAGLAELSALTGGSGQSAFVLDQIDILKSRRLFRKVIENNNLQYTYFLKDGFKKTEISVDQSPIRVLSSTLNEGVNQAELKIEIVDANKFRLLDQDNRDLEFGKYEKLNFGNISLTPNADIQRYIGNEIIVNVISIDNLIDNLQKSVSITPNSEKQSYIVNFSLTGPLISKSELIINNLINQYNDDVVSDQTKQTQATTRFIDSRLSLIGRDLDSADQRIQNYKTVNRVTDLFAESELNLKILTEADREVLEKRTQVQLVDYMINAISSNKDFDLLPTNIGLEDLSIEKNLIEYNKLILERDDLLKSSTKENPVVKNITDNIISLNKNLKVSLNNYRSVLNLALNNAESKKGQLERKVSEIPSQELGFKEISRQQKTIEAIYLFLLQKREENEIKASARPQVLKVIDAAYGSKIPVAPRKSIILFIALLSGFLIPFIVLYLKFLFDNKVHSRKEIEDFVKAPVLVEIPKSKDPLVKDGDRSSLAEAFRILRTNISFMLSTKKDSVVLFVTSTTSGEGKSFVSTNFARILASSGKKVLLIGGDIRSPKVLQYLGLEHLENTSVGITEYLVDPTIDLNKMVLHKPEGNNFDIIYSGYIAPNPAELLMNGYFKNIIDYGRAHYDYVIVDTAPVSLVTDTLLIAEYADLTMYVTRANYLEKKMLNIPKEMYDNDKLKNMAFILNDVDFEKGYGYGYGYGYGEMKDKTFLEKVKSFFKK